MKFFLLMLLLLFAINEHKSPQQKRIQNTNCAIGTRFSQFPNTKHKTYVSNFWINLIRFLLRFGLIWWKQNFTFFSFLFSVFVVLNDIMITFRLVFTKIITKRNPNLIEWFEGISCIPNLEKLFIEWNFKTNVLNFEIIVLICRGFSL